MGIRICARISIRHRNIAKRPAGDLVGGFALRPFGCPEVEVIVGVAMRPAVDGDSEHIAFHIKTGRAQQTFEDGADLTFEDYEREVRIWSLRSMTSSGGEIEPQKVNGTGPVSENL